MANGHKNIDLVGSHHNFHIGPKTPLFAENRHFGPKTAQKPAEWRVCFWRFEKTPFCAISQNDPLSVTKAANWGLKVSKAPKPPFTLGLF